MKRNQIKSFKQRQKQISFRSILFLLTILKGATTVSRASNCQTAIGQKSHTLWCTEGSHNTQHNDIQHNETQHKGLIHKTQHKQHSAMMLSVAFDLLFC
jgi:hypothetical protein